MENDRTVITELFLHIWRHDLVSLTRPSLRDLRYINGRIVLCSVGGTADLALKEF
jgi:hypothetical protein